MIQAFAVLLFLSSANSLTNVSFPIHLAAAHLNLDSPANLVTTVKSAILHPLVLLKDKDSQVRVAAISAVIEFSKQGKVLLVSLCSHLDLNSAADLIRAVKAATPYLLGMLKDDDFSVREAAVLAINEFSKQRKIPLLDNTPILNLTV
jgi:HEAT repeat protein